ncbi:nickel pincer cofactor biosynthesis protein LarC [Methanoplanus endosymbiosus]|uniref:Nickel pincer cofactor biosynthesis protein LarC n=1 Tax=Methanoplanus endosymbiosus TaxID=33865 RepID=A0A9E7PPM5_9EURY|nr:nickel pincer cofactor biosynthesis protein LarC [Methanoplanus endosymbiosus]UUX92726.1 nickel pincer cofactor biosynthesis protein LarC [Methanoplanus endosymbiosus]
MIISSLLDLGADERDVMAAMESVVAKPSLKRVNKCGISALYINTHAEKISRTPEEVYSIVKTASAPKNVIEMALSVFGRIADAEETIHGHCPHFHEVGADDAIADVIGACTAFFSVNPDKVFIMPVKAGTGFVQSAHGLIPVPAPATMEIMRRSKLRFSHSDEKAELLTPTGAALLSEFYSHAGSDAPPEGTVKSTGYGAGTADTTETPNVLRVYTVESEESEADIVDILETNVDDTTGENIAYLMQKIMNSGARDVSAIPAIMKKGRPGHLIKVICSPKDSDMFVGILCDELGTLGIRHFKSVHRTAITRVFEKIELTAGDKSYTVAIKAGVKDNRIISLKPEYEDIRNIAEDTGIPLQEVRRIATEKGHQILKLRFGSTGLN